MRPWRVLLIVIVATIAVLYALPATLLLSPCPSAPARLADGCYFVYLDLGTNIGIQVRKLYEPHLYPDAPILSYFQSYFGPFRNEVCSFGFEPNPAHQEYLAALQVAYRKQGWRVHLFPQAVSTKPGTLQFWRDRDAAIHEEWGARLSPWGNDPPINVTAIDFPRWFSDEIAGRRIPSLSGHPPPAIVMKMDIEGHDEEVLSALIARGQYCLIDFIYTEHHVSGEFLSALKGLSALQKEEFCKTKLIILDDESYHNVRLPLPM